MSLTLDHLPGDVLFIIAEYLLTPCRRKRIVGKAMRAWANDALLGPEHVYITGFKQIASLASISRRAHAVAIPILFKTSIKYDRSFILVKSAQRGELSDVERALALGADVDAFDFIFEPSLVKHSKKASERCSCDRSHMAWECRCWRIRPAYGASGSRRCICDCRNKLEKSYYDIPAEDRDEELYVHTAQAAMTALHHAAREGHVNIVRLLLQHGAQVDKLSCNIHQYKLGPSGIPCPVLLALRYRASIVGATALHYALTFHHDAVAQVLMEMGAPLAVHESLRIDVIHLAVAHNFIDLARSLLHLHGHGVDARDADGNTPLHYVAFSADPALMIKLLTSRGAEINAKNSWGQTPLSFSLRPLSREEAMRCNLVYSYLTPGFNLAAARALLDRGAQSTGDDRGMTPLHILSMVEEGQHPFQGTCGKCYTTAIEYDEWLDCRDSLLSLLLRRGDDVQAEAKDTARGSSTRPLYETALTIATQLRDIRTINILLLHGTPADQQPKHNRRPVWYFQHFNHEKGITGTMELLKLLVRHGATFVESEDERLREENSNYEIKLTVFGGMKEFEYEGEATFEYYSNEDMLLLMFFVSETTNEAGKQFLQRHLDERLDTFRDFSHLNTSLASMRRRLARFMAILLESGMTLLVKQCYSKETTAPCAKLLRISSRFEVASHLTLSTGKVDVSGMSDTVVGTWDVVTSMLRSGHTTSIEIVTCIRTADDPALLPSVQKNWEPTSRRLVMTCLDEESASRAIPPQTE